MTIPSATRDTQDFPHSFAPLLDRHYARPDFLKGLKTLMAAAQERIRNEHNHDRCKRWVDHDKHIVSADRQWDQ